MTSLRRSRTPSPSPPPRVGSMWVGIAAGMLALVVLLVFILQNLERVRVSFFTAHWRIPLALDLLFATVLGGLIVFMAGSLRIYQLRRQARRQSAQTSTSESSEPNSLGA